LPHVRLSRHASSGRGRRSPSTEPDHPDSIPQLKCFPLILDPIVGKTRLTRVLMDGGSGLNILYAKTYDAMGLARSSIQ
jgi:hypothetical protein